MIEKFTIATVAARPGRIGICRLPGRSGALAADVAAILAWRPMVVVSLAEAEEMEGLGAAGLGRLLADGGIAWKHFPIKDFGVPAVAAEEEWRELSDSLHAALDEGQAVLFHCRGGLGRSGMAAARLLAERGEAAETAIHRVRAERPGAVETAEQEAWSAGGVRRSRRPASADRAPPAAGSAARPA